VRITLLAEDRLRMDARPGPLSVEADSPETQYSPFHMLASGLASCTLSVLVAWGSHAGLPSDDLEVEVGWTFAEDPHRIDRMELTLRWPSLPAARHDAAIRAAGLCTIKKTLEQPPEVVVEVAA
jgi:uncharacterized OsmC-like protein